MGHRPELPFDLGFFLQLAMPRSVDHGPLEWESGIARLSPLGDVEPMDHVRHHRIAGLFQGA
jgi:hypothetical protein